ncbi:glycosyltransferase [Haloferax sp. S1W]|uniref:glycosyltransferase n=1 Tax=Haloferax sp. S1W TaxID=3377110 RepID=UPI0037CC6E29
MADIAFLVKKFPKSSETFIKNQVSGLVEKGHNVDVYSQYRPGESVDEDSPDVDVTYLESIGFVDEAISLFTVQFGEVLSHPSLLSLFAEHDTGSANQKNLWKRRAEPLLKNISQYDAIHAHYGPVGNGFQFLQQYTDATFVTSFYGYDASELLQKNPWRYYDLFEAADVITSLSTDMDETLQEHGCAASKIERLPLPVDISSFDFSQSNYTQGEPIQLLSVCRLVEKKGLRYALDAVSRLHEEFDIQYEIAGDGPLRDELEKQMKQLGIEDVVEFSGWKTSEEVAELMAGADIFIQPSVVSSAGDKEGTPTVLLEAQARGLPVVSTYHAGIPEIVEDGSSGYLVPERNVDELTRVLESLLSDPSTWPQFGRNGRQFVEDTHSLRAVATTLERIYGVSST